MSIGQTIKLYRREKGLTQSELAELIGVSMQAVSKWETNAGMSDIALICLESFTELVFQKEIVKESAEIIEECERYKKQRRCFLGISGVILIILILLVTVFVGHWLSEFSKEEFRAYIQSFGPIGWLVLLGLQVLQVFIALIPGELLETAAGYAFGPFIGTAICYVGVAIGSAIIFWLTRRYGVKVVEVFVSRDKINELRFINTEKKRNNLIFLFFLIPGTPKDLLTYFVGLTDIRFGTFLVISLLARIPSVVSSTCGGHLIGEKNYWGAIWLYGITGVVSFIGLYVYNKIVKRKQR